MNRRGTGPENHLDRAVAAVAGTWPEHDPLPFAVVARMARAVAIFYAELEKALAGTGVGRADLEALAHLRASGPSQQLTQRRLARLMARTAGTLSVRVDRLEAAGHVIRDPDPADRRGVRVKLTPRGQSLVDRLVPMRLATEAELLSALSRPEQLRLAELLRKLLRGIEPESDAPRPLGLAVLPRRRAAPAAEAARVAKSTGVAVADVDPGSPAAKAGVRAGDILVRAGGHRLRSVAQFRRLTSESVPDGGLQVTLVRDGDEHRVVVDWPQATRNNDSEIRSL